MTDNQISLDRYAPPEAAKIAKRLVRKALEQGWQISVFDGEETTVARSRDRAAILAAMATTGGDRLYFHTPEGQRIGGVWLIYCNGEDVISDYNATETMERFMEEFED